VDIQSAGPGCGGRRYLGFIQGSRRKQNVSDDIDMLCDSERHNGVDCSRRVSILQSLVPAGLNRFHLLRLAAFIESQK
jgi:hypothetical protein